MLELVHAALRWSHIVVGAVGLLLFWGAVLTPKGGAVHRRLGSLFVLTVHFVAATAVMSCAWRLGHPESYEADDSLTSGQRLAARFSATLLLLLATMVWSAAVLGVRALRFRDAPDRVPSSWLRELLFLQGAAALLLVGVSAVDGVATDWRPRYWIATGLGIAALLDVVGKFAYARKPPTSPLGRLAKHIECMIGCGIGYHTALLLVGINRLLSDVLPESLALLPWILPAAVGIPAIIYLTARYQQNPSLMRMSGVTTIEE